MGLGAMLSMGPISFGYMWSIWFFVATGMYFLWKTGKTELKTLWKMLPITFLGMISVILGAHWLITAGLVCFVLGDVFLDIEWKYGFVAGMASFGTGLILYSAYLMTQHNIDLHLAYILLFALIGVIQIALWDSKRVRAVMPLMGGVVVYMTIMTFFVSFAVQFHWLFGLGALLFYFSDSCIAMNMFRMPKNKQLSTFFTTYIYYIGNALMLAALI